MCGISALFSRNTLPLIPMLIAMNDSIHHRGPDDEGFVAFLDTSSEASIFGGPDTPRDSYSSGLAYSPGHKPSLEIPCKAALGHRRLAIVDLSSAAHQPMCSEDRGLWLTYNGEIYNHMELRQELEHLGHRFSSHSDSEVILKAYLEWGKSCLHRFNGMFSFVIYNSRTGTVFAARDRFAIKPLYYWISPDGILAIASEIKQFTVLPKWKARINGQAVYDFLNWGLSQHRSQTHFQGVQQLRGGECLEAFLATIPEVEISRWYSLPTSAFQGTFEEASQRFGELLEDSVRLRLRADVPVGSCLSGGLDSSSIVCLMNQRLKAAANVTQQNTFSACTIHKPFDESSYMHAVVDATGVRAHYTYPDLRGLFKELDKIIWHQDEPFASTSIFAQWGVFKLAKQQGVKVMLDGQGADEQLAGYSIFLGLGLYEHLRKGQLFQLRKELQACRLKHDLKNPYTLLLRHMAPQWSRYFLRKIFAKPSGNTKWLNESQLHISSRDPHRGEWPAIGPINQTCYAQTTSTNLPMLLAYEDRDSMAHSIEARTPFIDYRLVELAQSLPPQFKLKDGMTKRVLRSSMQGILPELIRQRVDKLGFATPEQIWIQKEQPQRFKEEIRRAIDSSRGILNSNAIDIADAIIDGKRPFDGLVWRMIALGRWMERFQCSL